ncbi:DUF6776 family protein [Catenovulum adriaticum]|uniref:Uncharacterized protein n=1 Tax=Catenovulum adriaticum TaxID=2984846 RepID=A0ABY7ANF5_9ALTE|nr:DUF6776 family protein [Catenovulum sp. TS8]WAJ69874.1 hypothetical protein OLW01_12055 [Catenovulum sp. TS8]
MKKQVINNFEFILKPNLKFYTSITGLAILIISFLAGFSIAKWLDQQKLKQVSGLHQKIEARDNQIYKLEQQLNFVRVDLEVGKLSLQQIQQDLQIAQQENNKFKELLSFYQNIMAPELAAGGVTIDRLIIEPTLVEDQFRYKVVLIQTAQRKKYVKGYIKMSLNGIQRQQPQSFELKQLSIEENDFNFNFKYFQILTGVFVLPDEFTPERIELEVTLPKRSGQAFSQTHQNFEWQPERTDAE